ncbi:hypothetical protein, conserved, partial [Entamoeba dispar SAW760]
MANKLLKYETLMIINDFSNINHNIFQSIKQKVIDLTIILYPEIIIDFEGLTKLKRLRIDFNNNDVSIFEELIKECFLKIKKNNKNELKEIYFKSNGKYAIILGKILNECNLIKQEIYIRFDKITEKECQGFIQQQPFTHIFVTRNELIDSIINKKVKLMPDNENNYWISSSLIIKKEFIKEFSLLNCPINININGNCNNENIKIIDITTCTTISSIIFNDCHYINKCSLILPKNIISFKMINTDSINISKLNEWNIQKLELISCNSFYTLNIPSSLIELCIDKCILLTSLENLNKAKLQNLKIISCSKIIKLDIPSTLTYLQLNDCLSITHLLNLENASIKDLYLKYCTSLTTLCLPSLLTLIQISNCEKLIELRNFSELKLLSFETIGLFNVDNLIFPSSLTYLNLQNYNSNQTTTLTNLIKLYQLKNLRILDAKYLEMLSFPVNLTSLILHGCHSLTFYPNLMELPLKFIDITSCDALTCLSFPTTLTKMIINDCQHVIEFPNLEEMILLKNIELTQCPSLEIIRFPLSLEYLNISKCKNLFTLPNLYELNIPFKNLLPFYYNLKHPLIPIYLTEIIM